MTDKVKVKKEYVALQDIDPKNVFKVLHAVADLPLGGIVVRTNPDGTVGYSTSSPYQVHVSGSTVEKAILYLAGHLEERPTGTVDILETDRMMRVMFADFNAYEMLNPATNTCEVVKDGMIMHVLPKHEGNFRSKLPVGISFNPKKVVFRDVKEHTLGKAVQFGNTRIIVGKELFNTPAKIQEIDLNCSQIVLTYRMGVNKDGELFLEEANLICTPMFKDFMATRQIIPSHFLSPAATVARALKKKREGVGYFESTRYVELVKLAQQLYATGTLRQLYITNPEEFQAFRESQPLLRKLTDNIMSTFKVKNGLSWMLKCTFPSRSLTGGQDAWFQEDYATELVTQLANKLAITQDGVRRAYLPIYHEHQVDDVLAEAEIADELLFKRDSEVSQDVVIEGFTFDKRKYVGYSCVPKVLNNDLKLLSTMFSLIVRPDAQKTMSPNARGYRDWVQVLKYEQSFWNYKGIKHEQDSHALNDLVLKYYENVAISHCLFEAKTVTPYELMMISQRLTEVSHDRAERLIALFGMYMQRSASTDRPDFAYAFFLKRDNGLLGKFPVEDARYVLKHVYNHPEAIEFLVGRVHPANWRKVHNAVIESSRRAGMLTTHYGMYLQLHNILSIDTVKALADIVDDDFCMTNVENVMFDYLDMKTKEGVLIFDRHRVPMPNAEELAMLIQAVGADAALHVEEIVLEEDLKKEGSVMRHCVGGYGDSVKRSTCRIIRYRAGSAPESATAEWRFHKRGGEWQIALNQIRSFANRQPPEPVITLDSTLREYVLGIINASEEAKAHYGFLSHIDR